MTRPDVPFGPLVPGIWVGRPNRFVVEVRLADGALVRAHTNNTGTMRTCNTPGSAVWLEPASNPNRKLPYTLRLVDPGCGLVGVDTSMPQKLFLAAMARQGLAPLRAYHVVASEVRVGNGSRLDVLLDGPRPAYVELKNVTLQEDGRLYFPDAVTARGARHLRELARLREEEGAAAFAVFIVQRPDGDALSPADHIDPEFGRVLREVAARGVQPLAFRAEISLAGASLRHEVPVRL